MPDEILNSVRTQLRGRHSCTLNEILEIIEHTAGLASGMFATPDEYRTARRLLRKTVAHRLHSQHTPAYEIKEYGHMTKYYDVGEAIRTLHYAELEKIIEKPDNYTNSEPNDVVFDALTAQLKNQTSCTIRDIIRVTTQTLEINSGKFNNPYEYNKALRALSLSIGSRLSRANVPHYKAYTNYCRVAINHYDTHKALAALKKSAFTLEITEWQWPERVRKYYVRPKVEPKPAIQRPIQTQIATVIPEQPDSPVTQTANYSDEIKQGIQKISACACDNDCKHCPLLIMPQFDSGYCLRAVLSINISLT